MACRVRTRAVAIVYVRCGITVLVMTAIFAKLISKQCAAEGRVSTQLEEARSKELDRSGRRYARSKNEQVAEGATTVK